MSENFDAIRIKMDKLDVSLNSFFYHPTGNNQRENVWQICNLRLEHVHTPQFRTTSELHFRRFECASAKLDISTFSVIGN